MREYFDLTSIPFAELRDLQEVELGCLLHLDKICRENGIRYTLGGGTCIGALREGGFIEWDDDVDIWIPRPDYERLHRIWDQVNDDPHYHLCRNSRDECYHINCSFIKDDRGTFINRHSRNEDINHGVPIDVMVMDAAPAGRLARAEQLVLAMVQSIYVSQRLPDHQGKVIRFLTHVPLALVRDRGTRYRIWKWCEKRMTRWAWDDCPYAVELTTGFKMKFKKMPREWFDTCKPVMFEGHELLIAEGAEGYMEVLFGDYMQLPPMKDRTPKHNIVYANMDEPYTKFKGVYYCVPEDDAPNEKAPGPASSKLGKAAAIAAAVGAVAAFCVTRRGFWHAKP